MINWYQHINNCLEQHEFILGVNSSIGEINLTAIMIIKSLYDQGLNEQEILEWISNATCKDESKNVLKGYFYETIKDYGIDSFLYLNSRVKLPQKTDSKIYITDEEIKYINNIDTTKENKRYLLGLLAYFKFEHKIKNNTNFNKKCLSEIYYFTFGSDDFNSGKRRSKSIKTFIQYLADERIAYLDIPKTNGYKKNKCKPRYVISFANMDADKGFELENFDQRFIDFASEKLTEQTKICKCCGTIITVTSKLKRDMCDSCYKDYIRNSKKEAMRKLRAERKNSDATVA